MKNKFNMKINGVDEIGIIESEENWFDLIAFMNHPDGNDTVRLSLTRDELVELKVRIDMLLEFAK